MRCFSVCAVEKLHRDEGVAALFADFVNGADVGMVQRGCGSRLALEAVERLRVARQLLRQKFQRDEAPSRCPPPCTRRPFRRRRVSRRCGSERWFGRSSIVIRFSRCANGPRPRIMLGCGEAKSKPARSAVYGRAMAADATELPLRHLHLLTDVPRERLAAHSGSTLKYRRPRCYC